MTNQAEILYGYSRDHYLSKTHLKLRQGHFLKNAPILGGKWAWPPQRRHMDFGLQTQPKSWLTGYTFWVNHYLEIVFSKISYTFPCLCSGVKTDVTPNDRHCLNRCSTADCILFPDDLWNSLDIISSDTALFFSAS